MKRIIFYTAIIFISINVHQFIFAANKIYIPFAPKTTSNDRNLVFSYAKAVQQAKPAVVNIYTKTTINQRINIFNDPMLDYFFGKNSIQPRRKRTQTNLGSGVLVSNKGYIVTNNHVIDGADTIMIGLNDGRTIQAILVGADRDTDLAILKINLNNLPIIKFADSSLLQVGDVSLAIGNPFGVGQTVTMGIISATGRSHLGISNLENFIQTDAAINPGNSGGALINAKGELVGINTAIFSKSGASNGIGFAIPSLMVKNVLENIVNTGQVTRGWLGVETQNINIKLAQSFGIKSTQGVIVSGVYLHSPANKVGIHTGDILLELDGKKIIDVTSWKSIILRTKPQKNIMLKLSRQGRIFKINIKLIQKPKMIK